MNNSVDKKILIILYILAKLLEFNNNIQQTGKYFFFKQSKNGTLLTPTNINRIRFSRTKMLYVSTGNIVTYWYTESYRSLSPIR